MKDTKPEYMIKGLLFSLIAVTPVWAVIILLWRSLFH